MNGTIVKPGSSPFPVVVKWLMVISGLMFLAGLVFFLPAAIRRDRSTHWPTSQGIISASGLKTRLHKPNMEPFFTPNVVYSYNVAGIPRSGTRIDFADGQLVLHKEEAIRWLETNYPIGKTVTVYHHPSNPDNAVLVPGAKDLILICAASMATTAVCCVFCFVMCRRAKARIPIGAQAGRGI